MHPLGRENEELRNQKDLKVDKRTFSFQNVFIFVSFLFLKIFITVPKPQAVEISSTKIHLVLNNHIQLLLGLFDVKLLSWAAEIIACCADQYCILTLLFKSAFICCLWSYLIFNSNLFQAVTLSCASNIYIYVYTTIYRYIRICLN